MRVRVLHVVSRFGRGGAERVAADILCGLDQKVFEPRAYCFFDHFFDPESILEETVLAAGVPVDHGHKRMGFDPGQMARCVREIAVFRPHIVHTHTRVLHYLLPALCLHPGQAVVHTLHNLAEHEGIPHLHFLQALAFRFFATTVCISDETARSYAGFYGRPCARIIRNGIGVAAFSSPAQPRAAWRAREGFSPDDILVAYVGRLDAEKEPALALRAFAEAARAVPRLRLLFAGDGAERIATQALSHRLGVSGLVHFLNHRNDVADILSASDIFVNTSLWEGSPLSVMEAMAAGLPVVCTAVGGTPELVSHGEHGFLIAPGQVAELTRCLIELSADADLRARLGAAGKLRAMREFAAEGMVSRYSELYLELARTRAASKT